MFEVLSFNRMWDGLLEVACRSRSQKKSYCLADKESCSFGNFFLKTGVFCFYSINLRHTTECFDTEVHSEMITRAKIIIWAQ